MPGDASIALIQEVDTVRTTGNELQQLYRLELSAWFTGPGCGSPDEPESWLRHGNVEEWIAYYWFRGATPQELKDDAPKEHEELQRLVSMVLESAGLPPLPEGRNPRIKPFLFAKDPLPALHRPLFMYMMSSLLCPLLTGQVMRFLGFRRGRVGGLRYWTRQRRGDVNPALDVASPRQMPLVFVHGLGVGLVPYYLFLYRLSKRHSGELYVPEFPFFAMAPWESVPSAREVVAQLQDMLAANRHTGAHFVGHSFGSVVIGWMLKMSPSSVVYTTLMEPAMFLMIKADSLSKLLYAPTKSCYETLIRYFAFRELFTVNLLCRNCFWEQSTVWPEDIHVPAVVQLAGNDHCVASRFVRRLLEHECEARKQRKLKKRKTNIAASGSSVDIRKDSLHSSLAKEQDTERIDIQWCEGFFHGKILFHWRATEKLFSRMRASVRGVG